MASEGNSLKQKHFYAKFGDKEYFFKLALYNNEGNVVFLNKNSLLYLMIDDNLFNPFHSGEMIISNPNNVIEKTQSPYVFLGNGRDVLDLEIIPIANGDFDADCSNEDIKKVLGMKFNFIIIECTEVLYNGYKCKRVKFVEFAQYMLSENIFNIFEIQKAGGGSSNYLNTNSGNAKSTGTIIKSILNSVYNDGKESDDLIYVDDETNQKIFEGDDDSKILLNPYGILSCAEVLNYVLSFHSYKKSPCILNYDRYSKKFLLISLHTLFTNHKKYLTEALKIPAQTQAEPLPNPLSWDISKVSFQESRITDIYTDSPTSKYNVIHSGNSSILSTSRGAKSMIFDMQTLNSDTFTKTFYDLFCKPFESTFGGYKVVPNYHLNPNKKNNYVSYKGVLPPILDSNKFLNQKLQSLLYLNNVYQIKLDGMTYRQPLTFVDVIKHLENTNGEFLPTQWDLNTIGRHLIVGVKHIFTQDRYSNEIETIKPYRLVDKTKSDVELSDFLNNFGG